MFGSLDIADHVGGGLSAHAIELRQLVHHQVVEIGNTGDDAAVYELFNQRVAQAIDIHDPTRREMEDGFFQTSRAVRIDTAAGSFSLFAHHLAAAHRAMFRNLKRPPARALRVDADHFRNDIPRPLNHHGIANLQTEPADLILVVQSGARHRDAADLYRCEPSNGRQCARPAHLEIDILDGGDRLPRGIFERNGPAWSLSRESELDLLLDGIDFDHYAVDLISQIVALGLPFFTK